MRTALLLALTGCATVNPYAFNEAAECPAHMTNDEYMSGVVRCKSDCASWGRGFQSYQLDCKCVCQSNRPGPMNQL